MSDWIVEEPRIGCDFCGGVEAFLRHLRHEGTTFIEIVCMECKNALELQFDDPPGIELHIHLLTDGIVQIERVEL